MGVTGEGPLLTLLSTGRCDASHTSSVQQAHGVKKHKTMPGNARDVSVYASCKFENSKLVFETRLWGSGGETGKLMR